MTSPTEELACVLAGVATSCTGERCFGHGTLRNQIVSLEMIDQGGEVRRLTADRPLSDTPLFQGGRGRELLRNYQQAYAEYKSFKNAPFPRLERETDLMIGFEGQLGIVVEVELHTLPQDNLRYLFFELPPWEDEDAPHLEILHQVRPLRHLINCCELIDSNSTQFFAPFGWPGQGKGFYFFWRSLKKTLSRFVKS